MVKLAVLTSSRADFGVYLPLLKEFKKDKEIHFEIISFGSHLSHIHGYTLNEIIDEDFDVKYQISTLLSNDSEESISTSFAITAFKFSSFWSQHKDEFHLVLCLGDRFEMFAAVISGIPFGIKFAHFYGGDFSIGAIDNIYRDALTHSAVIHFVSNKRCAQRVKSMVNYYFSIDIIGILSLHDLENKHILSIEEFYNKWNINLTLPTILITFHPETINPENNYKYSQILKDVFLELSKKYQLVITLPNADTYGNVYREMYKNILESTNNNICLIENFGVESYFSCMKYSLLVLGNTSSGISEAASFNKYFVNVGKRQLGREMGPNVISIPEFDKERLINVVNKTINLGEYTGPNIYFKSDAISMIIKRIKEYINHKTI